MFEGPVRKLSRAPIGNIPEHHLQLFCELVASDPTHLHDPEARKFFLGLASRMDRRLLAWLFENRFPLYPFVDSLDPKRVFPGVAAPSRALRIRWRLLKKRLHSFDDPALDTTLGDLSPMVSSGGRGGRIESAWRMHGRAVTAAAAAFPSGFSPVMKHLYWGGAGSRKIAFWERLVYAQATELTQIGRLAREVSRRTGRVVLSWHNASLGAAGGWGFDDPFCRFYGSPESFARAVRAEAAKIRKSFDFPSAMELCDMRVERLFAPRFARAVENSSIAAEPFWRTFTGTKSPGGEQAAAGRDKHEWPGALSPHQRIAPAQISGWIDSARKSWAEGLILLFALVSLGQRMLASGAIDSLALPWIDKFFISSRRKADIGCLAALFRFVSANIESPLILFWDDTPHRRAPSLGLALGEAVAEGMPFRGLGIFNDSLSAGQGAERGNAARIICGEYPKKMLFGLRPFNENHLPGVFRKIFEDYDERFFLNYDSSWKDNLAFLYAGTQVSPLLGAQSEMEQICPWVVAGGKRHAFGAWFRRILRRVSLGESREPGGLYRQYCSWANLL